MLEQPNNFLAIVVAAAANAMAGNLDVARSAIGQVREIDPNFRKIDDRLPYRQPELLARWGGTPFAKQDCRGRYAQPEISQRKIAGIRPPHMIAHRSPVLAQSVGSSRDDVRSAPEADHRLAT